MKYRKDDVVSGKGSEPHQFTTTLRGVTVNASRALGLSETTGSIESGKCADLVLWDTDNPAMPSYNMGYNPCHKIMVNGRWL